MAISKSPVLALGAMFAGTTVLAALVMSPAVAGGTAVAAPFAGGCTAVAHVDSQWGDGANGGQILSVRVANTSATASTTWTVTWPLGAGQRLVSAWDATVGVAGGTATAKSATYNGALAPGASATFGVQFAGTGPAPTPGCDNGATAPSSPAPGGPDRSVALADDQSTVTLLVGQTLGVSLGAEFVPPVSSGTGLSRISTRGGYPTGQPVAALFRATAPGRADVTAHTDHACLHTKPPCSLPIRLWSVHVEVVAGDGRTVTVSTADNRGTVNLNTGDTLVVNLADNYVPVKLSTAGVLVQRDSAGGYPTGQPLVARFVAASAGTVTLSSLTDAACNHEPTPCPSPQIPWSVTVVVTS